MTLSRRHFLTIAGASAAGASTLPLAGCSDDGDADDAGGVVEFYGEHQAGIVTPVQDRLHFAAFDIKTDSRDELIEMLKNWTDAAAKMTQGRDVGQFGAMDGPESAPPEDTGEAFGLKPARLTLTFGFGPGLFETSSGIDRFGLAARRPAALYALPHFPGEKLDHARSGGEICVQACSDDPQVAVHAIRNLARIGLGKVSVRWSQLGFGRTSSTTDAQKTTRNLFGFKDGTANLKVEEQDLIDQFVWVAAGDDAVGEWLVGGSYLVARRINMRIEIWDRISLGDQQAIIGRDKKVGAPLSGGGEFTTPDFELADSDGAPIIGEKAHVRLAHPDQNSGARILRRGFNFADGTTDLGNLDAGLFFLAFTRNPDLNFIPMQLSLARNDEMSEYIQHTGSAIFAVAPGIAEGGYIGQSLFEG